MCYPHLLVEYLILVIKIENMTDTGTGEINSATVVLNARKGAFITEENILSIIKSINKIIASYHFNF